MNLWVSMEDEGAPGLGRAGVQPEPRAACRPPRRPGRAAARVQAVLACPVRRPGARAAGCEGAGVQLRLRHSAEGDPGGVPGERHRHHRHGDHTRRGVSARGGRRRCHRRVRLRGRGSSRLVPPVRGGLAHRHVVARPAARRSRRLPVIAAGGIADARGVIAALALGAEGVQIGTAFLGCEESGASRLHREALRGTDAGHTGLTKGFTGRLARGIHNRLMEELNRDGNRDPAISTATSGLVRNLSMAAEAAGRPDLLPLWAGQSAALLRTDQRLSRPLLDFPGRRPGVGGVSTRRGRSSMLDEPTAAMTSQKPN